MCSTLLPPSLPQLKEDRKRQICFRDLEDGHLMVFNPLNPRKNGDLWVKSHPRSPYDSNAWLRRLSFEKKCSKIFSTTVALWFISLWFSEAVWCNISKMKWKPTSNPVKYESRECPVPACVFGVLQWFSLISEKW